MPNRVLRDGILRSARVCQLNWPEEIFYRRLHSVVDDYGRYYADPGMLRAACYPRQLQKVSDSDIGKWLTVLVEAALVRVYPSLSDGECYLEVLKFRQHIRAKDSKFPPPQADEVRTHRERTADALQVLANEHEVEVEVVVEDEKPLCVLQRTSRFAEFWKEWPDTDRKTRRTPCEAKWKTLKLDDIADDIIAHIDAMKRTKKWLEGFEPAPLTYLNASCWLDPVPQDRINGADRWIVPAKSRLPDHVRAGYGSAEAAAKVKEPA